MLPVPTWLCQAPLVPATPGGHCSRWLSPSCGCRNGSWSLQRQLGETACLGTAVAPQLRREQRSFLISPFYPFPNIFPAGDLGQTTKPDPSTPRCLSSHIPEIRSQRGPPPGWGWDWRHRRGVSTARPQHPGHRAEGAAEPGTTTHVSTGTGCVGIQQHEGKLAFLPEVVLKV